jgi:general secretion pathway protein K
MRTRGPENGGALLAVLWLAAGLAAIAFTIANTVRGETERTATGSEGLRAHYLATGAVERGICYMMWGPGYRNPDGSPRYYERGMPGVYMNFPTGIASLDIIPERSKVDINRISPEDLTRLLISLGQPPPLAEQTAAAIVDWRTPVPEGASLFDQFYAGFGPTFRARHASFEEIEELLLVKGMTPELFHGGYTRDAQGRLVPMPGLKDCVSVFGSNNNLEANFVEPPVLAMLGIDPPVIAAFVERRRAIPFTPATLAEFARSAGPAFSRLTAGGYGSIFTLRASARVLLPDGHLSDLRRDAAALIKIRQEKEDGPPYTILRWYEN